LSIEFDVSSQARRPDSFEIEQYIRSISGVQQVVSKEKATCLLAVTLTVDENIVSVRGIVEAIQERYHVVVAPQSSSNSITQAERLLAQQARETASNRRQFLYSAVLTLPVFIIGMFFEGDKALSNEILPGMSTRVFIMFLLTTPVQFVMGWRFHHKVSYNFEFTYFHSYYN
jgi:cation transport ATPase